MTFTDATKTRFGMRLSYRTALFAQMGRPSPAPRLFAVIASDVATRHGILDRVVL